MHIIVKSRKKMIRHKRRYEKRQLQREVFYGIQESAEDGGSGERTGRKIS